MNLPKGFEKAPEKIVTQYRTGNSKEGNQAPTQNLAFCPSYLFILVPEFYSRTHTKYSR